ncbi:MAG: GWxTD domain-containing protein [Flavobacteriales bacterium]
MRMPLLAAILLLATRALALEAWFDHKVFQTAEGEHYVETFLSFTGPSLRHAPAGDSLWYAQVDCTLIIRQDSTIADYRKLTIDGPKEFFGYRPDFLDVQRFLLPEGEYTFELELTDAHNSEDQVSFEKDFEITAQTAGCSDLMLVRAFAKSEGQNELSKSGLDLLPYVSTYYPQRVDVLMFYAELYGTEAFFGDSGKFLVNCYLADPEDGLPIAAAQRMKREKAAPVVPVMQTLDISTIPTGDYDLVLEMRNRQNELVARETLSVSRSNRLENPTTDDLETIDPSITFAAAFTDRDTLLYYIDALQPIATAVERVTIQNLLQEADMTTMQQYFYYFWARRDEAYAESIWLAYKKEVDYVDENFGTRIKHGFETDQGRIYLKWGAPNSIGKRHQDIYAYPYEIWHYYTLGDRFRNKRFVFWNRDLVGEEFELLHSDVPGEINNQQWKQLILGRDPSAGGAGNSSERSASLQILEDLFLNP